MQLTGPCIVNQATVGVTAVQLRSSLYPCMTGVTVKASAANTGKIYVGLSSGVTTANGFQLSANQSQLFPVSDASAVWVIADAASQVACFAVG